MKDALIHARLLGAMILSIGLPSILTADSDIEVRTFTYKRVGDLEIKADVHRPAGADQLRPVLVYIHGGALINGGRESINRRLKTMFLDAGYVIVSIDYRLAPETKLPSIVEDLEDAFKWLRSAGPRLFQADTRRIAVAGGSAGGCLTLLAGYRVQPAPTVLVSLWGYGDLIGEWYSTSSPHPRHNARKVSWEEVAGLVDGPPIANARDRKSGNGGAFYGYCRQQGLWPQLVSGFDPEAEPEKFRPYMTVENISPRYPPTLLLHGTADTDVPYEQSVMVAKELRKHRVPHRLIGIEGAEHGLRDGKPAEINKAYDAILAFVNKHMMADGKSAKE